ncbi:MAG TPA: peptidoglycan-associated lipoprotein Pal [Alphaproteobacteria bacterium]|nr:peptidoglycan-associated lipoprotein Pal [Alphaproteobacteria bacterium]
MRLNTILTISAAMFMLTALTACPEEPAKTNTGTGSGTSTAPSTGVQVTPGSQQDLVANYGDRIFFEFDKADLRPDARAQVGKWAEFLKKYPQDTVTIQGHADERGTREYNLALGERRAASAKKYLSSLGIDSKRIATISYGKENPDPVGSNEAAWAQNRRDIMVVN